MEGLGRQRGGGALVPMGRKNIEGLRVGIDRIEGFGLGFCRGWGWGKRLGLFFLLLLGLINLLCRDIPNTALSPQFETASMGSKRVQGGATGTRLLVMRGM